MQAAHRARNLLSHWRRMATDERLRSAAVTFGRLDYARADIHLRLSSRDEFHRLKSCQKEPWTVRWIEQHLRPGEVLYDVGANIGAYTLVAAIAVPQARVVAFEPGPANFASLCANLELNAIGDRVTAVPLALGDRTGSAALGHQVAIPGASPHLTADCEGTVLVLIDRLDAVVERFGLPSPNHLKLDVDGSEPEVLAGAERVLSDETLRTVMVELDRTRANEVVDRLSGYGLVRAEDVAGPDRQRNKPGYFLFTR